MSSASPAAAVSRDQVARAFLTYIQRTESLTRLAAVYSQAGKQLFLVGGSVRDLLLGRATNQRDLDLTTDATPDETERLLRRARADAIFTVGKKYGTIGAKFGERLVETTTFRLDQYELGDRHPDVTFASSIEEDLERRDITINAIAVNLATGDVVDPTGGLADLQARVIRVPGEPALRFREDPVRLIRVVRLSAQLGFRIDPEALAAIREAAGSLAQISRERVRDELNKILVSPRAGLGLRLLAELGLMAHICPEVVQMQRVLNTESELWGGPQLPPARYKDVFNHTLRVVDNIATELHLRLAALFHDIAKPVTFSYVDGKVHFLDHDRIGRRMARRILTDLRYDHELIRRVCHLVEQHLRPAAATDEWTDRAVRRFINTIGVENLEDLFQLARADITGSNQTRARGHIERLERLKERCERMLEEEGREKIVSPLDGDELMALTGSGPGRWIKEVKDYLLELVLDGELGRDDKEEAWRRAQELIQERGL